METQQQIAVVTQRQQVLLAQAEHARLVRQLRADHTSALTRGYAAARRALRGRRQELELQEPIPIRPGLEPAGVSREKDGPIAA
jgi:hypothetical protein